MIYNVSVAKYFLITFLMILAITSVGVFSCPSSIMATPETGAETGSQTTDGTKILLEDPLLIGKSTTSTIDDPAALSTWLGGIIKRVIAPIGAIAFLMFVAGGFFWIFSAGNEERVKRGRDIMIWTAIGLIVIFAAYAILTFVIGAIGINADATAAR